MLPRCPAPCSRLGWLPAAGGSWRGVLPPPHALLRQQWPYATSLCPPQLRGPAATEQHISLCRDLLEIFCSMFGSGDVVMGTAPASGGWLVGCAGCMGRNVGAYSHAHGGSGQAELWMKGSAGWLTRVKPTRAWSKPVKNHLSSQCLQPHLCGPWLLTSAAPGPPGQQRGEDTAPHKVHVAAKLSPALVVSGLTSMVRNPSFYKEV